MATLGDKQQEKELGREVGAFNLSKKYEVRETAKSVLNAYPSRAEWTMNPWLPYFRKFMNYIHFLISGRHCEQNAHAQPPFLN